MKYAKILIVITLIFSAPLTFSCTKERTNHTKMNFPGENWDIATPESQGVNSQMLDDAMGYLAEYCGKAKTRETVIIRNGYMIWHGDNIDTVHGTWSVGKVFTSSILGLLIDDSKCKLSDQAAVYESRLSELYPDVTLRQLANFTSGYDGKGGAMWGNFLDGSTEPWIPVKPLAAPGEAFLYWDDAARMFGLVVTKIANQSMYEMIKKRVCDPIGIRPEKWSWDVLTELDNLTINHGAGFVNISASDLARFGHLFLNNGNWNGMQLISRAWIEAATSVQVPVDLPNFKEINPDPEKYTEHMDIRGNGIYGYHWFVNGIKEDGKRWIPDAPPGTYSRSGYPHNKLVVIPEWNMVIVRLGGRKDGRAKSGTGNLWNNVIKKIGEAIMK